MSIKPSEALRFLGAVALAVILGGLLIFRVTSCAPVAQAPPAPSVNIPTGPDITAAGPPPPAAPFGGDCQAPAWRDAALRNGVTLRTLAWAPFRRPETGWEVYAPLISREIGSACSPASSGFAAALAAWQGRHGLKADGIMSDALFATLRTTVQRRRPVVLGAIKGVCTPGPPESTLAVGAPAEGYGGKAVILRPRALAAYRQLVAAARAEEPDIRRDPRNLTVFSSYRSPQADAARCVRDGNCDGVVRATCSPHRTGLALDLYVGQAPGFGPDSSADPNRLFMTRTPTYRWMLANAHRFGFVNYPFEPWHWEWTGETP